MSTWRCAVLVLCLSACADHAKVQVRAFFESGIPLTGVEVSVLPFDAERVLDSLDALSPTPKPDFSPLQAKIQNYRRRDTVSADPGAGIMAAWLATKDSVARMASDLSRQDRKAPGYKESYARFRQLYDRFTAREAEREARLRSFYSADRTLAEEATHASDSLRAWERVAYRDFAELANAEVARRKRAVVQTRTDSVGTFEAELPNGPWWLTAHVINPDNPFEEFHWNVPVTVAAGLPVSLPLMRANAVVRWRH